MWWIIKLIQAFMGYRVTFKNEEDSFKNEGARVVIKDSHCKYMQIFMTLKGS